MVVIFHISHCNKYSAEKNKLDDDSPFRMMKINLIWNKAKLRLSKDDLARLYQDLKQQDKLELELKKKKAAEEDDDGEFEALVTRKSLDILLKYGLEGIHPDTPPTVSNQAYDKHGDMEKWEKVMMDKKLSKLWKKAQLSGFSERELAILRVEFLHHVDKIDELNALHSEISGLSKESGNTVADFDAKQEQKMKQLDLKKKHKELRDSITKLEEQISTNREGISVKASGGFTHPKVIELWFAAKNSNFTVEELNSMKEELHHFEHKLKKLEHLQQEHETVDAKMKLKNMQLSEYPEKYNKISEKVAHYLHKVKKYETDLRQRIGKASVHNEL